MTKEEYIAVLADAIADPARFWSKVDKTPGQGPNGECWAFKGGNAKGYRLYVRTLNGRRLCLKAHRLAWTIIFGTPGDLCVLHHCDNPPCVRPNHLFLGTKQDNSDDKLRKGRQARPKGVAHPQAKLTEENVREIRRNQHGATRRQLAERYGVTFHTIRDIIFRDTWKHI